MAITSLAEKLTFIRQSIHEEREVFVWNFNRISLDGVLIRYTQVYNNPPTILVIIHIC